MQGSNTKQIQLILWHLGLQVLLINTIPHPCEQS